MAKKKQEFRLLSLTDDELNKEPDVELAQTVIEPPKPAPVAPVPPKERKKAAAPKRDLAPPPIKQVRGTFAPENKVRATFNIDEDLHKAIKDYSFFEEVNMVEYIFEHLVKPDLAAKGYYPPKRHKK